MELSALTNIKILSKKLPVKIFKFHLTISGYFSMSTMQFLVKEYF